MFSLEANGIQVQPRTEIGDGSDAKMSYEDASLSELSDLPDSEAETERLEDHDNDHELENENEQEHLELPGKRRRRNTADRDSDHETATLKETVDDVVSEVFDEPNNSKQEEPQDDTVAGRKRRRANTISPPSHQQNIDKTTNGHNSANTDTAQDDPPDAKTSENDKDIPDDPNDPDDPDDKKEDDPADLERLRQAQLEQMEKAEEKRIGAIALLTDIETQFAQLRDQLHQDKMYRHVAEIEMCSEGSHPELDRVFEQIGKIRDEKVARAENRRRYQRQCLSNQIRACRTQVHQQFLKDQAEQRVALLLRTTQEWYQLNRERRAMDYLVADYTYRVPERKSVQAQHLTAVYDEISLLNSVQKYIGFPAAPEMKSLSAQEINDDLAAISQRI